MALVSSRRLGVVVCGHQQQQQQQAVPSHTALLRLAAVHHHPLFCSSVQPFHHARKAQALLFTTDWPCALGLASLAAEPCSLKTWTTRLLPHFPFVPPKSLPLPSIHNFGGTLRESARVHRWTDASARQAVYAWQHIPDACRPFGTMVCTLSVPNNT